MQKQLNILDRQVCLGYLEYIYGMKGASVKERIIETASDLFYKNGYNQTGINQIVKEAEVAKASMYQHFRSKEDLAVAYLIERHKWWMNQLGEFIGSDYTGKEKILRACDFIVFWMKNCDFRGCGFQNILTDLPQDHNKIRNEVRKHKTMVQNWIQGVILEEQHPVPKSDQLSREIATIIEGAIMLSQIHKKVWPALAAKETCRRLME